MVDRPTYEGLFRELYEPLLRLSASILKDQEKAEDVIQEVFLDFWRRRSKIKIQKSYPQYLKGAVYRKTMQRFRQEKQTSFSIPEQVDLGIPEQDLVTESDLLKALESCLEKLPPRTGLVFRLNRQSGLTQAEAAKHLEISVKTVENQMLRAFRLLRDCMQPFKDLYQDVFY